MRRNTTFRYAARTGASHCFHFNRYFVLSSIGGAEAKESSHGLQVAFRRLPRMFPLRQGLSDRASSVQPCASLLFSQLSP